MPSPFLLNAGPGQDKFSNFYVKFNGAISEIIEFANLVGTDLVLTKYDGTQFIVDLSSIAGGGGVEYVYQEWADFAGPLNCPEVYHFVIGAYTPTGPMTVNLPPNPAEQPRIITIIDALGNAGTNPINIIGAGGPFAVNVDGHSLTLVYDDVGNVYWPSSNYNPGSGLPLGTVEGQNIRWDDTLGEWVPATSVITTYDTIDPSLNSVTITTANGDPFSECGLVRIEGGDVAMTTQQCSGTEFSDVLITSSVARMRTIDPLGTAKIETTSGSGIIEITTTNPSGSVNIDAPQGIIIADNTPAVTTDALYNIAGDLYFNGNQICVAPCGGTPYTIANSSIVAPGVFNVPAAGSEAERVITIDTGVAPGAITINLPTAGIPNDYRITIKRVNLSPASNAITINSGVGNTIDTIAATATLNNSAVESVSLLKREGVGIGTYDWIRDDNYIDPASIAGGFDYDIQQLNAAGSPHSLVWTGIPIYAIVDTSGGANTVNLPTASPDKKIVTIKRNELGFGTGANNITVTPTGGDGIDGIVSSVSVLNLQMSATFVYDPSVGMWYRVADYDEFTLQPEGGDAGILTPVGSPHTIAGFPRGRNRVILVDTSTGNVSVNMPVAPSSGTADCIFTIKKIAAINTVLLNGNANLIDGVPGISLSGAYEAARLIFSGGEWRRI